MALVRRAAARPEPSRTTTVPPAPPTAAPTKGAEPVTHLSWPPATVAAVAPPQTPVAPPASAVATGALAGNAPDGSFINRELSLLTFNRRVLALAADPAVPLLERLRFLTIVGSNLDEFFEIRVAGVKEQLRAKMPASGMPLPQLRTLLADVSGAARALIDDQYRLLNVAILPALAERGVRLVGRADRSPAERAWVTDFFQREVRPLLTPIGLDPAHPFPQIVNKSLNFIVELSGKDAFGRDTTIAVVKAPRLLPRVIKLPREIAEAEN